jgi:hypothetical protein
MEDKDAIIYQLRQENEALKKDLPSGNKKDQKRRQGFFRKWFPAEEVSEFIKYYPPH